MGRASRSLEKRFWAKVQKTETCWLWKASVFQKTGYGQINDGKKPWTMLSAHRVSWELHFGPIPDGMEVLHKCDVRRCVNPDHLFLGTQLENMKDMVGKGRSSRGESRWMAKLSSEQVREIRQSYQQRSTSLADISQQYGISEVQASRIVNNRSWRWLV